MGEPDWPFGATHCRFTLRGEGRQILERAFSIQDDGAVARADNFAVRWRADGVQVVVSGSEQGDRVYVLGFDGSAEEAKGPAGDPAGHFVVQESKKIRSPGGPSDRIPLELMTGFEPVTSSLPRTRSTC